MLLLMKSVTGQVRWQVTGMKPTRNFGCDDTAASEANQRTCRFNARCATVMSATHPAAAIVTVRFNDMRGVTLPGSIALVSGRMKQTGAEAGQWKLGLAR